MRMVARFFLAAILVATPTLAAAHSELAREPHGIDTLVPMSTPVQRDSSTQKITIYTALPVESLLLTHKGVTQGPPFLHF
jgi:hypothetical protein